MSRVTTNVYLPVVELGAARPTPEGLADYLVYRPTPRARRYRIFRTDTGFRVAGRPPGDEELAEALRAAGAKEGDEIAIGDEIVEFA